MLERTWALRLNDENSRVTKGDFIEKLARKGVAHTFINSGTENLVLLDDGTAEKEDTCYYHDKDVCLH